MKTKKLYNKKNKTKKRQRKIYKGGVVLNGIKHFFTKKPTKSKKYENNDENDQFNLTGYNNNETFNVLNPNFITSRRNKNGEEEKNSINYEKIYEKKNNPLYFEENKTSNDENKRGEDYEKIYGNKEEDNPFYYEKNKTDIGETAIKDFKDVFYNASIYIDKIKEYVQKQNSIEITFENILLKIFRRNFYRILEFFDIELYYFLYYKLLEEEKNNVFDLFDSFDQSISFIKNFCLKNNGVKKYRFDFTEISHFFNISKTVISITSTSRNLFEKNELKNIIDTFSYSILCININSYIYYNKSFKIGKKIPNTGGKSVNKPKFLSLYDLKSFRDVNLFRKEDKEKDKYKEKDDPNEYTIYNFFETPEKNNKLKKYFSDNKKIIIEKIKNILNKNYLLKNIVFLYIKNEKKNIDNTEDSGNPDGPFESEIKEFKKEINKIYYNFLKNFYNEIFSNYIPNDEEKNKFLSEKKKINNSIKKFDEILNFDKKDNE